MGGQHAVCVTKERWERSRLDGTPEESIHSYDKNISTTILKEATSKEVCSWAAGFHQRSQRETFDTLFSEVCENWLIKAEEKGVSYTRTPEIVSFTGDEIWDMIEKNSLGHTTYRVKNSKKLDLKRTVCNIY